ncbi:MAG: DUF4347 domain-containing protein, partial [Cyanobacteria bacterium P01_A01_bin.84]
MIFNNILDKIQTSELINTDIEKGFFQKNQEKQPKEIVFIDADVSDYQTLVAGTKLGTKVVILDGNKDGVEQITQVLSTHELNSVYFDSVHIVSHGSPGCLYLGNSQLNLHTLGKYTKQLENWFFGNCFSDSSSSNSSLYLYACNLAAGDAGEEFLDKLHQLTKANIAASHQKLGYVNQTPNWSLNINRGEVSGEIAFNQASLNSYRGTLSHFRGGQIAWAAKDLDNDGQNDDVEVTVRTAWRLDGANSVGLQSSPSLSLSKTSEVRQNIGSDYTFQTSTFAGLNLDPNTPYLINYSSNARIGGLKNNANGSWNIQTVINFKDRNRAPQVNLPILTEIPALDSNGQTLTSYSFPLVSLDRDGDPLNYRLANLTELGGGSSTNPQGLSVDPNTGQVTWNLSGLSTGLYSAGFVVEDLDANGQVKSKSHVDVILDFKNAQLANFTSDIPSTSTYVLAKGDTQTINFTGSSISTLLAIDILDNSDTSTFNKSNNSFTFNSSNLDVGVYQAAFQIEQLNNVNAYEVVNFVINTKPTSANANLATSENTPLVFSPNNFAFSDDDAGDTLQGIEIVSLPSPGKLFLDANGNNINDNGEDITQNQLVSVNDFSKLKFLAANDGSNSSFSFKVSDGAFVSDNSYTMSINVTPENDTPTVANPIPDQTATEDGAFNFTLPNNTFSDPDGDNLTYSATLNNGSPLPSWLNFNPQTGEFSGTPGDNDVVDLDIKVTATDPGGETISDNFTLQVTNTNDTPTVA